MWKIQIQTLGFANYNKTFQNDINMPISSCIHKHGHEDRFWDSSLIRSPTWLTYGFPNAATKYNPKKKKTLSKFGIIQTLLEMENMRNILKATVTDFVNINQKIF